jgi:hypothetical protein
MRYRRFSLVADAFSIPQNHAVFVDIDFFNTHRPLRESTDELRGIRAFGNFFAEVNSGHRCSLEHLGGHGRICSRDEAWRVEHPALCVLPGFFSCLSGSSQDRGIGVRRPFQYVSIAKLSSELELVGIWMF